MSAGEHRTPTPDKAMPPLPKLFILRRQAGGVGGAEKVVERFRLMFGSGRETVPVSANSLPAGRRGPGWLRAIRFAMACDKRLHPESGDIIFSMERGPRCDIYRAGDGAHRRWLEIAGRSGLSRLLNPVHLIYPLLERRSLRLARKIVANSEMVARDLTRFHPECAEKIVVIRNGVNLGAFTPAAEGESKENLRRRLDLPPGATVCLFVGSGWERKGLARAAKLVGGLGDDTRLVVLGKGRPAKFSAALKAAGMTGRTDFRGPVSGVADFLRAADLFVLPTMYDPCSNACIEALAAGCPVVTTETNGASEFIRPGRTGVILSASDEDDVARVSAALRAGFDSPRDIAASVSDCGIGKETLAYEKLFAEILADKGAER